MSRSEVARETGFNHSSLNITLKQRDTGRSGWVGDNYNKCGSNLDSS